MCRRCGSLLTPYQGDWRCLRCGWGRYPVVQVFRFSDRERETRRRQRRVAIVPAVQGACVVCRAPERSPAKFCRRHRDLDAAAASARRQARRAAGLVLPMR